MNWEWRARRRMGRTIVVAVLAGCSGIGGSGDHCIAEPCPMPMALNVTVTTAAGGSVAGASIAVTGAELGGGPCESDSTATTCQVPGYVGQYTITVSAPGYQPATRTLNVSGTQPSGCGCPTTDTQQVTMVLTPSS